MSNVEHEKSSRRRFMRRVLGLGAAAGAASLTLSSTDRSLIHLARAGSGTGANVQIDEENYGVGETELRSAAPLGAAFFGWATASSGQTYGVFGRSDSEHGIGVGGYAIASNGNACGVQGSSSCDGGAGVRGLAWAASAIPIVAQAASGQTSSIQEWQNCSGTPLAVVDASGRVGIGTTAPERILHLVGVNPRVLIEGVDSIAPEVNFKRSGDDASRVWALYKNGDTHDLRFYQGGDKVTIQNGTGNVGIGTTSPQALLHVSGTQPNILMGDSANTITSGVVGGTISGGGASGNGNSVTDDYGTVGGGYRNQAGNNFGTTKDRPYTTVGGGTSNYAIGNSSTVGGGSLNIANGAGATVPGGVGNEADGDGSFAAGTGSHVNAAHSGAILFADLINLDFNSAAANEFAVRCRGGARFVTAIDVSGGPTKSVVIDQNSQLGLGTTAPARPVHLRGNTACFRMDRDANSAAFILVRTAPGDFNTVWKTFYVGVDASAANNGSFFIGDVHTGVSGASDKRLIIDNTGHVGIGRTPAANALEVEGNASKTTAGSWLTNSDRRIKTNIEELEDPVDIIERLHPVRFRYTDEYRTKHPSVEDHEYCNFIAQEYREVFPHSVKEDGEGLLQMDDHNTTPYLVAAVQHLIRENHELRARLEALERNTKATAAS